MDKQITKMINTTIKNLTKAKQSNDEQLVQAVLINLNSVLPTYIDALEPCECGSYLPMNATTCKECDEMALKELEALEAAINE